MITVAPSTTFEATAEFATGLTGTLGIRITDNQGTTTTTRTTTGIIEYPAGSGIYAARALTSPTTQGQYTLVWDDGTTFAAEDLLVAFTAATSIGATGRDLCSLTDVTKLVPGYTAGDDANTDATLSELITEQSRDAMERCGREFKPIETIQPNLRSFDIDETAVRRRKLFVGDLGSQPTTVNLYDAQGNLVQALTSSSYVLLPRVVEDWQPYSTVWFRWDAAQAANLMSWGWGWDGGLVCQITATWGFPSVPTTVKDAVARLVIVRYLNDVTNQGTQFSDAADRAAFNTAASVRQALDALDRFYVPAF